VWSVIGAVAAVTEKLEIGTMVTCPMIRTHPAIIAQAAATSAAMMPGRFFLGVGSGEALNEHIVGERWPRAAIRLEMLEESMELIRCLEAPTASSLLSGSLKPCFSRKAPHQLNTAPLSFDSVRDEP